MSGDLAEGQGTSDPQAVVLPLQAETLEAAVRDLQEQRARFALAQAAAEMGSWEWEIATGRVHWSETLELIHGLEPGTFPGTFEAVVAEIHPDDRERVEAAINDALRSGGHRVDYRIVRRDGSLAWVSARGRVVYAADGAPAELLGVCFDVTARKRAEAAFLTLMELSNRLADCLGLQETTTVLMDSVVPSFADWCLVHIIDEAFPADVRTLVRHKDPAKTEQIFRFPGSGSGISILGAISQGRTVFVPQVPPEVLAYVAASPDGEVVASLGVASVIITPLVARGRSIGGIAFIRGPESLPYDGEDRRLAQQLSIRVAITLDNGRLFDDAERARHEAIEASAIKDEFLDMVSHEMRTPLTIISNGAKLLQRRRHALSEADFNELLAEVDGETARLQDMVENLLLLSRTESNTPFDLEPCLVVPEAEKVLAQFRRYYPEMEFLLRTDGSYIIEAHTATLARVFSNLLGNAVKYAGQTTSIEVDLSRDGNRLKVAVLDRGPGLAEGELDRIFDRFYRSPTTARQVSGSGIGLAVCRSLLGVMGGDIRARNRTGGGLSVEFTLPLLEE